MKLSKKDQKTCDKYSKCDENDCVNCNRCPLIVDRARRMCKANSIYNQHKKEWESDIG